MDNNTQLVSQKPLASILARQEKLMAIEHKILVPSELRRIKNLLISRPSFFLDMITRFHPIQELIIDKYDYKWGNTSSRWWNWWENLSSNRSLPWSIELIEKYKDKWDWERLSRSSSLPWSIELIEKYNDWWDWSHRGLSQNTSLPWSIELIERYKDRWDWSYRGMSQNTSLPWSIELIEKYDDKWDWESLFSNESIILTVDIIKKYGYKWWYYFFDDSNDEIVSINHSQIVKLYLKYMNTRIFT